MAKHITDGTINSESTFQDETVTYSESETIEYTSCVYYADTFNDLVLSNTQVTLNSGLSANNTTLNGNGILYVSDGGAANGTKINEDGKMIVSDGGLADNSLINAFGSAEIENGGTANETKVNGGTFSVSSGAVANNTVLTGCQTEWEGGNLLSTAKMNVSNGGSANGITINTWSCLEVEKGGKVSNISIGNGGGNDTFCFGKNWGNDTVEQLAGGKVTLWFADGSESNWNSSSLTYSDGTNSVTVSGVTEVTLKFGGDAPVAGAFLDAASEKIFEDKNSGMLA